MKKLQAIINAMIEAQDVCFLGSVDEEGCPNIKAMLKPRMREGLGVIYFSTNTSSLRVAQFRANSKSCVYFCDAERYLGVMLKGTMKVLEDQHHKDIIWAEGDERYYPRGPTDPDYCVLKFTATAGRYYNGGMESEDFTIG